MLPASWLLELAPSGEWCGRDLGGPSVRATEGGGVGLT
jgi:hypothetical protein